eukprot:TRINITY_DN2310_c0_g1_i2.p1 TRINITY_DN2310_c0_g1~~TRINITY_DN2310_c0_g1_i2.p1  ORF type:complete len:300 (+),score=36.12 TRINITY_DN2310_c0_g1_i2:599-1498(+)
MPGGGAIRGSQLRDSPSVLHSSTLNLSSSTFRSRSINKASPPREFSPPKNDSSPQREFFSPQRGISSKDLNTSNFSPNTSPARDSVSRAYAMRLSTENFIKKDFNQPSVSPLRETLRESPTRYQERYSPSRSPARELRDLDDARLSLVKLSDFSIEAAFSYFDWDEKLLISAFDIERGLKRLGISVSFRDVNSLMRQFHKSLDGFLTLDEFAVLLLGDYASNAVKSEAGSKKGAMSQRTLELLAEVLRNILPKNSYSPIPPSPAFSDYSVPHDTFLRARRPVTTESFYSETKITRIVNL